MASQSTKSTRVLEGSFGDKKLPLVWYPVEGCGRVLINVHGAFGDGFSEKYDTLIPELVDQKVASCVLYSSFRKAAGLPPESQLDFEDRRNQFYGKRFEDELLDLRTVLRHVIGLQSPEGAFEIILNGNSLGGLLAFVIATEFPQVKRHLDSRNRTLASALRSSAP